MKVHKNIRLLTWFNFFTDFKLYAPIAIIYFARVTGSYAIGMSIFSISMIAEAVFEIPTGVFSDYIGRKNTIVCGAIAAVLFSIFYAIGGSFLALAIAAVFDGLSQSFYSGNNEAFLHDTLKENEEQHRYGEHFGKTSAMFQFALACSAVIGGVLATWSFPLIMWLSVIPQAICLGLSLYMTEPKIKSDGSANIYSHLKEATQNFIKNEKLRLLSISSILGNGFGEASYLFQSAFYNTLWPLWAIGLAKTVSNLSATASYHFSGKILKKINAFKIFIVDNVYNRTVNIIATAFPTAWSPFLMSMTSALYGVTDTARSDLMQKEFSSQQRATMGSLNSLAGSIFFGVLSFALGYAADKLAPAHAMLILQIFQIGNLFIYIKLFNLNKKLQKQL